MHEDSLQEVTEDLIDRTFLCISTTGQHPLITKGTFGVVGESTEDIYVVVKLVFIFG